MDEKVKKIIDLCNTTLEANENDIEVTINGNSVNSFEASAVAKAILSILEV